MEPTDTPPPAASLPRFRGLRPRLRPRWPRRPERAPEPSPLAELGGPLRAFRAAALWGIAALIATADGAAFTESYRGLLEWAEHHLLGGFWAAAFPLQVDLFIVVGELVLFIAMADRWGWRDRLSAWAVAALGLAVSVAGNVGHIAAHDLQSRGTAAVPPVAAFGALWLGLGVLKRVLRTRRTAAATAARDVQQAAERDALAEVLDGLSGAVRALAERPAPEPAAALDHGALLDEAWKLLAAVKDLAERPADAFPAEVPAEVPADAESAALIAMKATLAAGNPLSARQLELRFGLSRGQAARVREAAGVLPELSMNGSAAGSAS
ncbi:MAG TPA: DUF2637 domain-containing protein [Trebonia sp.]|jgi:hypothetical protein